MTHTLPCEQSVLNKASALFVRLGFDDKQIARYLNDALFEQHFRKSGRICALQDTAYVFFVIEGWTCISRPMGNGTRNIERFCTKGDFCNLQLLSNLKTTAELHSQGDCLLMKISLLSFINDFIDSKSRLLHVVLEEKNELLENCIMLGSRSSYERLAFFFCQCLSRLQRRGFAENNVIDIDISQFDLADFLGVSAVHLNRTWKALERTGIISKHLSGYYVDDPLALRIAARYP